jgi:hypothetical protein
MTTSEGTKTSKEQQRPFFAESFRVGQQRPGATRKTRQTRQTLLDSAPPVTVDVHWDEVLPTLNEFMGRVEGLAQDAAVQSQAVQGAIAYQAQLMQQMLALQQQVTDLTQQHMDASGAPVEGTAPNANKEDYMKYILQRVDASANAAAAQVDLLQRQLSKLDDLETQTAEPQGGNTGTQAQFDEIIALLGEIRERIGDLASGAPSSQGGFVDRSREEFVDHLYSNLKEGPEGQGMQLGQTRLQGDNPYSRIDQVPAANPHEPERKDSPKEPSNTFINALLEEEMAIKTEKKEYLDEKKEYFTEKQAYIAEMEDLIKRRRAWLGIND